MKMIAINGSPRKQGNTAILLENALQGAAAQGAETEMVQLSELKYQGCSSCFACKLKNGGSYGVCAMRDELSAVLEKIRTADALLVGSPIYLGAETGAVRSFMERLIFPYLAYDGKYSSLFSKRLPVGIVYTMNVDDARMKEMGYEAHFERTASFFQRVFGSAQYLTATDTKQFDDYSRYEASGFDAEAKEKRRRDVFPDDCAKAYLLGESLVGKKE